MLLLINMCIHFTGAPSPSDSVKAITPTVKQTEPIDNGKMHYIKAYICPLQKTKRFRVFHHPHTFFRYQHYYSTTYAGSGVPSLLVVVIGVLAAAILILIITTLSLVLCLKKWSRKRRGKSREIAAIPI